MTVLILVPLWVTASVTGGDASGPSSGSGLGSGGDNRRSRASSYKSCANPLEAPGGTPFISGLGSRDDAEDLVAPPVRVGVVRARARVALLCFQRLPLEEN